LTMDKAVIVDPTTRAVLGVAPQWASVMPLDVDAVSVMQEAQKRATAALAAPVIERHADEAADRLAAMEHNKNLIAQGVGATSAKPKKQRAGKNNHDFRLMDF